MSALKLYGGQFTLSTQLKILKYPVILSLQHSTTVSLESYPLLQFTLSNLYLTFRFLYPKQLLSHHYWQPHQREKFAQQDVGRRRKYQLPLVREVGRLALRYKGSRYSTDLMSTSVKVWERLNLQIDSMLSRVCSVIDHKLC